jgi:cytochrome c553
MKKFVFAALIATTSLNALAQDQAAGEAKFATCMACHGASGQGGVGPQLAGQEPGDIVSKLVAYRNRETLGAQSALMWPQAASLTDADIENLAAYISTL